LVVCCLADAEVVEKADQLHGGMQSLLFPELQIWSVQETLKLSPKSLVSYSKLLSYCDVTCSKSLTLKCN
jgi:hypothetical protein